MTPNDPEYLQNNGTRSPAKSAIVTVCAAAVFALLYIAFGNVGGGSISNVAPTFRSSFRRALFAEKGDISSFAQKPLVVNAMDVYDESDGDDDDQALPQVQVQTPEKEYKVTNIALIGERHSGTNWITDHLQECFGEDIVVRVSYSRYKHWFQTDYDQIATKSSVVVAMFRDPYDWVTAMFERPHHAHNHMNLSWREFVTKPWEGPRGIDDKLSISTAGGIEKVIKEKKSTCIANYTWNEVIPCSYEDSVKIEGVAKYMYELNHDGSGRAYPSIVDLRREKIMNFLSMPSFRGVKEFYPMQYEDLNRFGTSSLLKTLEKATGKKAKCEPFPATGTIKHKIVDPAFIDWMNRYVDWQAEGMIGYEKRQL